MVQYSLTVRCRGADDEDDEEMTIRKMNIHSLLQVYALSLGIVSIFLPMMVSLPCCLHLSSCISVYICTAILFSWPHMDPVARIEAGRRER